MKSGKRIVLFTLFAINLVDQPAPEVRIVQGILSGKVSAGGSFFEYVGIPYASTNSSTRFKAPLPPPSWNGIFRAVDENCQCPQPTIFGVIGNEDCLKINIYVPVRNKKPFPVMVYIHGGTYIMGNGGKVLYGPDFLVRQDVILVTFNYRLGALGFLCLGIKDAPGNAGLKDQVAALRWVKKNIAAFGGDPDNVTVFGLSAGATSVSMLIASDATNGLFNRAILQSGVSTSSWAINRQPLFTASLLAKELGYNTKDPKAIYEIFSKIHYKDLIAAKPKKPIGKYFDFQLINYPCVEKVIEGEEAVLTDLPYNLFRRNSNNISVIYGTTSREGVILLPEETEDTLKERDSKYVFAPDLNFPTEDEAINLSNAVKEYYFGLQNISFEVSNALQNLNTHLYFEMPSLLESEIVINKTSAPIYNYYFNYSGGRNFLKFITGYMNEPGACHGDELMYLFKGRVWPFAISEKDQTMINWMTRLWTNFARYGDPTPTTFDWPVRWDPSTKDNMTFLYIDDELKMGPIPNPDPYRLWKDIYSKYRKTNKAPLPPPKWDGVYKAVEEFYQCPQHTPFGVVGTEDCLKINVYVPANAKGPLPVMAYIHGGAFILGNGGKMVVGPDFLVKQDVILVSFNYRLGALGFLCLRTEEAPGNAGLKDQIAALRWIKKNIAAFGGDPDNVTIFGTSAGGVSVSLLVASEATNGLFQRAIMHSGCSLANFAVNHNPVSVASKFISEIGYDTKEPENLYEIYSKLSYTELVLATAHIPISQLVLQSLLHAPCVEKKFPGVESVLRDLPYNLLTKKPKNITLMYSTTDLEGLFFIDEDTKETLEKYNKRSVFGEDLVFGSKKEEMQISQKVKEYYFGKEAVSERNILKLSDLYTHLYFEVPVILEAEILARTIDAPVYGYYFTYSGGRNFVKFRTKYSNETGASHGDDLLYVFSGTIMPFRVKEKDQIMIDRLTTMLANFAKYGNPTPNDFPVRWIPHSKDKLNFLNVGDELKMMSVPNPEELQFWKDIYNKYRRTKASI